MHSLVALALLVSAGGKITGKVKGAKADTLVVYVEKAPGAPVSPQADRPRMTQKNTQFQPGVLIVVQGQTIDFPNEDKFYHNVFSASEGNDFDLGLYRGGVSKAMQMKQAGEVDVYCNIHPDMAAKILVLQNPFYAQVGEDGSYTIDNVPPGSYTLVAWGAHHVGDKKKIEVKDGQATAADYTLKAKGDSGAHLNKDGQPYGRYK